MFVLLGWGQQMSDLYGVFPPVKCGQCNNETEPELRKIGLWFSIWFIPLIRYCCYYAIVCPICGRLVRMNKITNQEVNELVASSALPAKYNLQNKA